MRQHLILALVLVSGSALADTKVKNPKAKPTPIDLKSVFDKLEVYRDEAGKFVVSPKPGAFATNYDDYVFYGDAKTLYKQWVIGSGSSSGTLDWLVWSPRVRGLQNASISLDAKGMHVRCKAKDGDQTLTRLSDPDATDFLKKATFLPTLWQRQAHYLARDEEGVYYYVDRLNDDYGGKGFRVFAGQKGAMKELAMTNVVSDSAGEIYATKTGELKIVTSKDDGKAFWKKGGAKTELIALDPRENRYVIYRELGIYGDLGVVCDDQ